MTNEDAIYFLLKSNEHHHAIGDLPHSAASIEAFNKAIEALKAERPQGEWVYKEFDEETGIRNSYFCSKCGCPQSQVYINFCGNCGADMHKGDAE